MAVTNWIGRDPTTGELTEKREQFLGALASDPGTAVTGDTYFSTVSNVLRSYNGTTWQTDGGGSTGTSKTFAFFMG